MNVHLRANACREASILLPDYTKKLLLSLSNVPGAIACAITILDALDTIARCVADPRTTGPDMTTGSKAVSTLVFPGMSAWTRQEAIDTEELSHASGPPYWSILTSPRHLLIGLPELLTSTVVKLCWTRRDDVANWYSSWAALAMTQVYLDQLDTLSKAQKSSASKGALPPRSTLTFSQHVSDG
jgi:hypothetical protein